MFAFAKGEEEVDALPATHIEECKRGIYNSGIETGIEKGAAERNREIAVQLIKGGEDKSVIMKTCGLSMEQLDELKNAH